MPIYMRIDGIEGEVTARHYEGWHELFSFEWGLANAVASGAGGGAGVGKASFSDLSLTKPNGKGSPGLMIHCARGTHFPSVKIALTRSDGEQEWEYQSYDLQDATLTGFHMAGDGDSIPSESLSLNFTKIRYAQRYMLGDGSVRTQNSEWDIRRATGNWTP
jgi:type VI secretion system secreted protein Hcp